MQTPTGRAAIAHSVQRVLPLRCSLHFGRGRVAPLYEARVCVHLALCPRWCWLLGQALVVVGVEELACRRFGLKQAFVLQ